MTADAARTSGLIRVLRTHPKATPLPEHEPFKL
jgi:hypothetical protein